MLRAQRKLTLSPTKIWDLHLAPRKSFTRTEANVIATKACALNFPRLIKRCLLNLPTSLQETQLPQRQNLVQAVRDLYYSTEDAATFDVLLAMTSDPKKYMIIDNVASIYYSNVVQLPEVFNRVTNRQQIPIGFRKTFMLEYLETFQQIFDAKESKLFQLLKTYDAANDATDVAISAHRDTTLPYFSQKTAAEKDAIFDTVALRGEGTNAHTKTPTTAFIRLLELSAGNYNVTWDHSVIRGELIYTEFSIDGEVLGCGFDFNHRLSSNRAAKMVLTNPSFERWFHTHQDRFPAKRAKFDQIRQECLDEETAVLGSPAVQDLAKFF